MSDDHGTLKSKFKITKYDSEKDYENDNPREESTFDDNVFLTEGINKIWNLIANIETAGYFSEANAHIGVGSGTTAEDAAQTGLQGGSTFYKPVDSGYPNVSNNQIVYYATFGGTEANFQWNEFCVANGGSNTDTLIDRKQSTQGTKAPASIWEFEVTLSIS